MERELTQNERARLADLDGVTDLAVTCEQDSGHGPCGTYLDWADGKCARGHDIEIIKDDGE